MISFILLFITAAILFYWKVVRCYNYWPERGVKQRKQVYLFGDVAAVMFRRQSFFETLIDIYKAFPSERYIGSYQGMQPMLIIRDPEIIKQITVKEFDHFVNHRALIPDGVDPLWSRNLFVLKDTRWRNMRSAVSPTFTSSKMKIMFSLILECTEEYIDHFLKKEETIVLELKDALGRYANDIIATIAFGIKCDSVIEKDSEFYLMGKRLTTFGFRVKCIFFLYSMFPAVCEALKIKFFTQDVRDYFIKLVEKTIETRENEGIVRPDMINQLLEARKGKKINADATNEVIDTGFATVEESTVQSSENPPEQKFTNLDIAAQAVSFFFGGFESVSTLMCFLAYELTVNPDAQRKLQEEIDDTFKECNGKLTYEALLKMKYMDMVLCETLRKWPTGVGTDRVCTKPFTIEPVLPHETRIHLKPGDVVFIPINGIHRDPQYYPNPDVFDPERFSDENKVNIKPYTYLPFGVGPRNCIGSRFALLQTKTVMFQMLSKFNLVVTEKTQVPIKLDTKNFNLMSGNGFWVSLEPRSK